MKFYSKIAFLLLISACLTQAMEKEVPLGPEIDKLIKDVQDILIKKTTVPTLKESAINTIAKDVINVVKNADMASFYSSKKEIVAVLLSIPLHLRLPILEKVVADFPILAEKFWNETEHNAKLQAVDNASRLLVVIVNLLSNSLTDERKELIKFVWKNEGKLGAKSLRGILPRLLMTLNPSVLKEFFSLANDTAKFNTLHYAAENLPISFLKKLIATGIDPNIVDSNGKNVLDYLLKEENEENKDPQVIENIEYLQKLKVEEELSEADLYPDILK